MTPPEFRDSDEELMDQAMDGGHARFGGVRPSEIALENAIEMHGPGETPLIMCGTVRPATASGKIELFSQSLEDRYGYGVPRFEPVVQDRPLVLMSPSSDKRTNATFGGSPASQGLEIVEINPADAAARDLTDGDTVMVWNDRGAVALRLKVTDATRAGVLFSPKGTWRATSDTGQTVNALIPADTRTDIGDGACYNETFVDMRKA